MRILTTLALTLALGGSAAAQMPFNLDPDGPAIVPPPGFSPTDPLPQPDPGMPDAPDAAGRPPAALKGDLGGGSDPAERTASAAERRKARLDRMFEQLAKADDKGRADRIAKQIMRRLTQSGSDTVDLLMTRAAAAMEKEDYGLALDLLDGVVRMKPDFAEGWNRRATANFLAGNLGQSVADIEQTLRYEPRHWGAILGLSMILVALERNQEALAMMDRALAIYPMLEELRDRRNRLQREVQADL